MYIHIYASVFLENFLVFWLALMVFDNNVAMFILYSSLVAMCALGNVMFLLIIC